MTETAKFFLRFYGTSEAMRQHFVAKVLAKYGGVVVHDGPGRLSMNPFGPRPHEVLLQFASLEVATAVSMDHALLAEYEAIASPGSAVKAQRRAPGDVAFQR